MIFLNSNANIVPLWKQKKNQHKRWWITRTVDTLTNTCQIMGGESTMTKFEVANNWSQTSKTQFIHMTSSTSKVFAVLFKQKKKQEPECPLQSLPLLPRRAPYPPARHPLGALTPWPPELIGNPSLHIRGKKYIPQRFVSNCHPSGDESHSSHLGHAAKGNQHGNAKKLEDRDVLLHQGQLPVAHGISGCNFLMRMRSG